MTTEALPNKKNIQLWSQPHRPEKKSPPESSDTTSVTSSTPASTTPDSSTSTASSTEKKATVSTPNVSPASPKTNTQTSPVSPPASTPTTISSRRPEFDLDRPQIKLKPFQQTINYSLNPVEHEITLENNYRYPGQGEKQEYKIPLRSSSLVGESGSGLSVVLAHRALNNYRSNKPSIILSHGLHHFRNLTQALIDCADPNERAQLLDSIEFVTENAQMDSIDKNKKIYIVSSHKLSAYLKDNLSFRPTTDPAMTMGVHTWKRSNPHKNLANILPLAKIHEILVDDAHSYAGQANDGFTQVLATLLYEINASTQKPVNIFGTSATPSECQVHREDKDPHQQGNTPSLQFDDFFSSESRQPTPTAQQLIEKLKHYKTPSLSLIELDNKTANAMQNTDASKILLDSTTGSINARIVDQYQQDQQSNPGKKWHIIVSPKLRAHATQLCGLFNLRGINARVLTSPKYEENKVIGHCGYFRPLEEDEQIAYGETHLELNDESHTQMKQIKREEEEILADYEKGGCDVLIELDTPASHSTQTDKVVDLTLRYDPANHHIKRLLGEAVRSGEKRDIDYVFLNPDICRVFENLISGKNLQLGERSKGSASTSTTILNSHESLTTSATARVISAGGTKYHETWFQSYLGPYIRKKQKEDPNYNIDNLVDEFSKLAQLTKSPAEIKAIVSGLETDTKVFRQLVDFMKLDTTAVNIQVPELMGVDDEKMAIRILENQYFATGLSEDYNPNQNWLKRLDPALRLAPEANGETKDRYRLKTFAEILYVKFGKEVFENRFFLDHALRVFTGDRVDYKLFGLLVNALSSNEPSASGGGFSFRDIVNEFPQLTGSRAIIPFSDLQKQILERYPDGPPLKDNLDVFFTQQLYDDFGLDFGTLVQAVTTASENSDQTIINDSVKAEIQKFLESNYRKTAEKNSPQGSSIRDDRFDTEVKLKAEDDLSTITKEILYSQLIAKIWGLSAKLKIIEENFILELGPDSFSMEERKPSSIESVIDVNNINPGLAIAYDHTDFDSAYDRVDIKKRLARSLSDFIIKRHNLNSTEPLKANPEAQRDDLSISKSLESRSNPSPNSKSRTPARFTEQELTGTQKREIQVLLGAVAREDLSADDKKLLREFFESKNIKISKQIVEFYDRLGVENLEEAKLVVAHHLKNSNPDWTKEFTNFNDLVAEFIYTTQFDIFNQAPKQLSSLLAILAGEFKDANPQIAQELIRKFVDFAQKKGSGPSLLELIPRHYDLLGIKNLEELKLVIENNESLAKIDVNVNSNTKVKKAISKLCKQLNLTSDELYEIAGIKNPVEFYREPIEQFIPHLRPKLEFKPEHNISEELWRSIGEQRENIQARQLLKLLYGDKFQAETSEFEVAPENWPYKVRVEIKQNHIDLSIVHYPQEDLALSQTFKSTLKVATYHIGDKYRYELKESRWESIESAQHKQQQYLKVTLSYLNLVYNNPTLNTPEHSNWFRIINTGKPGQSYLPFVSACDAFIRHQLSLKNNLLPKNSNDLVKETTEILASGPINLAKTYMNLKQKQDLIRAFIEFTNRQEHRSQEDSLVINLQDVLEKTPKAVGVRTVEELKTVVQANKDLFKDLFKNKKNLVSQVLQFTGLTKAEFDSFKDPNGFTEYVMRVLKENEEDLPKLTEPDALKMNMFIRNHILVNYLCDHSNFMTISIPSFRLLISDNEIKLEGYPGSDGSFFVSDPNYFSNTIIVKNQENQWQKMDFTLNQKIMRQILFNISIGASVNEPHAKLIRDTLIPFYKIYDWPGDPTTAPYQFTNLLTRFYEEKRGITNFQTDSQNMDLRLLGFHTLIGDIDLSSFFQDMKDFLDFAGIVEPEPWRVDINDTIPAQLVSSAQPSFEDIKQKIKAKPENFLESLTSNDDISVFEEALKRQFPNPAHGKNLI